MSQKYLLPQEIELSFVVPAIRRELTLYLKEKGYGQHDIAQMLHVTDAAVSQYASGKRATEITFPAAAKEHIHAAAEKLINGAHIITQMTQLLHYMKQTRITCQVHIQKAGLEPNCQLCTEGHHERASN